MPTVLFMHTVSLVAFDNDDDDELEVKSSRSGNDTVGKLVHL